MIKVWIDGNLETEWACKASPHKREAWKSKIEVVHAREPAATWQHTARVLIARLLCFNSLLVENDLQLRENGPSLAGVAALMLIEHPRPL